jgi:hypothetical protein
MELATHRFTPLGTAFTPRASPSSRCNLVAPYTAPGIYLMMFMQ